jgi:GTP cyclohydrolase IIa
MTLVQIDNYGPWTVEPSPKREADIQILQSSLYADVQHQFSSRDGLAFATRFDNILAISNGIDLAAHRRIQQSLHARYPFTLSMGVGSGRTAVEAQAAATLCLQEAGSARSAHRRGVVAGAALDGRGAVEIAHLDIDDATSTLTDALSAYDAYLAVKRSFLAVALGLRALGATAFFMGGDNVVAPVNGVRRGAVRRLLADLGRRDGVSLKAGFGRGPTALEADLDAKHHLERVRAGRAARREGA